MTDSEEKKLQFLTYINIILLNIPAYYFHWLFFGLLGKYNNYYKIIFV